MRILALDPSINLLKLLSDNLEQYGYQFQGALDIGLGHNVLHMGYQPEIIMVNLCFCTHPMIPQLEAFFGQLNYPYKAIVAIIDNDNETSQTQARNIGFHGIITKPFNLKSILTELESLAGINADQFTFLPLDTRREVRLPLTVEVILKIVDENSGRYFQERTITEDISLNGTSVLTLFEARIGAMVNITLANDTEACIGIVRGAFIGNDRIRRLNLEVIGKRWQDFYMEINQLTKDKTAQLADAKDLQMSDEEIFKNRYKIERELGKGGLGIVYQALDLIKNQKVALKFLIDNQTTEQQALNQKFFEREIKILSEVHHPNIVAILDSGFSSSGAPFFVMDYIEGTPLDELMRLEKVWSVAQVLHLLKQLCPALYAMHVKNIIHRDLKPANIMIQRKGKVEKAILLDLGIAKMVRGNSESSLMKQVTRTGMLVGTLNYISPEQCLDLELDDGVDIYSLGIMVYQLLTGQMPFKGTTMAELILAHVQGKPILMSQVNPNIDKPIESVVLWALAKSRDQRPRTIMDFLEHFEQAASQLPNPNTKKLEQKIGNFEISTIFFLPEK